MYIHILPPYPSYIGRVTLHVALHFGFDHLYTLDISLQSSGDLPHPFYSDTELHSLTQCPVINIWVISSLALL